MCNKWEVIESAFIMCEKKKVFQYTLSKNCMQIMKVVINVFLKMLFVSFQEKCIRMKQFKENIHFTRDF